MLTAVLTTFDRNAMPTNLLTVPEWRRLAQHTTGGSWMSAAHAWARRKGGALVLKADGSLVSYTRRDSGKISQRTYRPGSWEWEQKSYPRTWVA